MAYETHKKNILIVEDSRIFSRILKSSIEVDSHFMVVLAENFQEAINIIQSQKYHFFAALLDLNLPDAPNGEVVDYALKNKIPSIVFTAKLDDDLRDQLLSKGIVDYVLKERPSNIEYIVSLLKQLDRNNSIKVLIVDDSRTARLHIRKLLNIYQFAVLEAEDGEQALAELDKHRDIRLIITDFNMPKMNGIELTKKVRELYNKHDIAIIGMSTYGNNLLSARFLKVGGSDFINKPFLEEEFFCRINQNLELLEYIKDLRIVATRDFLTGLYNRRYFMDMGKKIFSRILKSNKESIVALMDIDFFKRINDTHGHDAGDLVLKTIGDILRESFHTHDLIARFGGEEFCFLLANVSKHQGQDIFNELMQKIEQTPIYLPTNVQLNITVSIGICTALAENLESALSVADKLLYQAKSNGRNQIVID